MSEPPNQIEVVAFRASPELAARIEAAAKLEGLPKAAVVRRAVLRDLKPSDTEAA